MNSSSVYCPDRKDVVSLDLSPIKGREQDGRRPVLVLSPYEYNVRTGLCVVAPITRTVRTNPFEAIVPHGLDVTGVVLSDQTTCKSWRARGSRFICKVPDALVDEVVAKFKALLP